MTGNFQYLVLVMYACAAVADPTNGGVSFNSTADGNGNYAFGTVATFACDSSFSRNGAETRTCGGDGSSPTGSFEGTSPTCERES